MQTQRGTFEGIAGVGRPPAARPAIEGQRLLRWAVGGTLLVNVFGMVPFFFLPGADDAPAAAIVLGVVLAVVAVVAAVGLWHGRRWGARVTLAVTVLNVLSGAPGIAAWPSTAIGVGIIVMTILGIALVVLLRRRELRAELH